MKDLVEDHTKDLITRLEAAEWPSRKLNEAIAFHVQWRPQNKESQQSFAEHEARHDYATAWIAHSPWRHEWAIPNYTGSVDAALALVPDGMVWSTGNDGEDRSGHALITHYYSADPEDGWSYHEHSYAATPALALCIAALKAREAS